MAEARAGVHPSEEAGGAPPLTWPQALAKRLFLTGLQSLRDGSLELQTPEGSQVFGNPSASLRAQVHIVDPRAWTKGVLGGEIGLGEAYMAGWWTSPDPVAVVRLAVRNMAAFDRSDSWLAAATRLLNRRLHRTRRNDEAGSRRNIGHHYDLGNDFYRLFLDETLAYSCALYRSPEDDLRTVQLQKFEAICTKLKLGPQDRVLEIGTGWGGFAAYAARTRGCRITTTTISRQQHDFAAELFRAQGLTALIDLRFEDYRHLTGTYDKVVSIEMFEAVGLEFYDTYFGALDRLLTPEGTALIQTITMNEQRFPAYHRGTDWIQKHIFPGAELASVKEVLASLARATDLSLHHLEDIGTHYARTLAAWRQRFWHHIDGVRNLGYDETFIRMWDFYLASCEGAFAERYIGDVQLLLTKRGNPQALLNEPWS